MTVSRLRRYIALSFLLPSLFFCGSLFSSNKTVMKADQSKAVLNTQPQNPNAKTVQDKENDEPKPSVGVIVGFSFGIVALLGTGVGSVLWFNYQDRKENK